MALATERSTAQNLTYTAGADSHNASPTRVYTTKMLHAEQDYSFVCTLTIYSSRTPKLKAVSTFMFDEFVCMLRREFDDLDGRTPKNATEFLGCTYEWSKCGKYLYVGQKKAVDHLLQRTGYDVCRPTYTPAPPKSIISDLDCPADDDHEQKQFMKDKPYRSILGDALWITRNTRPDCTHAVNALARVGHNPGKAHWQHLQHLLRYISTTRNHKLTLTKPNATEATDLRVYTDANYAPDWGTQYANYRSTSGYVSLANGSPLSWRSRRQTLTAQSSVESEYYGAADAAKEALKVSRLLTCFMQKPVKPTLHIDNKSAISMSHSPSDQDATKHLDVRAHFLRECVRDGVMDTDYCPTADQWGDGMTKSLPAPAFATFTHQVGVRPTPPHT